ncbi:hypothetical protein [Segetibacter sp.]|uniref:hypothetical protein n=1 Tax=Segetibacter sp. TaxID=2231182 RepID=UPI002633498C|nr:hypothetical protein [Segetibacter sp.]MCW3081129.1 hypothetical protein [Segetibacter sp.]
MYRRKFVSLGTATLCVMPILGLTAFNKTDTPLPKPAWLLDLIKINDDQVKQMAAFKVNDTKHRYYGGYFDWAEIPNPHSTVSFINDAGCAICCPESIYCRSQPLLADISLALQCLLKMQHADGTIDLLATNFQSPPDTGFMVKRLAPVYTLLRQSNTPGAEKPLADFKTFLQRAGEALITGGIHTPNHRWVVSAALVKLNELWSDQRYVNRVNEWLGEHIDIDADGQYTEKSTSGYSAVVDRVLITISKGLNKPEILDAVRKNIKMMRYYIHPNGEVVTEASNRQDKGQIGTMENYYYACRYLSLLDRDGEMASICRLIEATSFKKLADFLNYFLEDPSLWKALPGNKPLPDNYVKSFPYSGIVRIRRGQWDSTILSNNAGWFTFHKSHVALQGMRVAASFFGKGQFQSETIEKVENSWVLTNKLEGVYYQPYPKEGIQPDGDLSKMPRSNRKKSNIQHLQTTITITESGNGINVEVEMNGTEGVPVSMELIFRRGGKFTGVQQLEGSEDIYMFNDTAGTYSSKGDTIHFGPGKLEHKGLQLRGALPHAGAPTVYLTGFTPFKHTIQFS